MGVRDPLLGFLRLPNIPYITVHPPFVSCLFKHQSLKARAGLPVWSLMLDTGLGTWLGPGKYLLNGAGLLSGGRRTERCQMVTDMPVASTEKVGHPMWLRGLVHKSWLLPCVQVPGSPFVT